jgi:homocysteine S-methyltransferase
LHARPQAPSQPDPLGALLAGGRTVLLDGGLATELEAGGADLSDALWSARLLVEDPDAIARAHIAFFRAGADVAITASYQASFRGFARRGIDEDTAAGLMRRSVGIAREAAAVARGERHERADDRPLLVAASVGPYGAFLADGSEYHGRYGLGVAALRDFHRRRMAVLLEAGPDLLAIETIPEIEEGEALATLLDELDGTAWLSFTCSDGARLRSGAPVEEAFALADRARGVVAVGINCTAPEHALELVERAVSATDKPILVYPNSGEDWDPVRRHWSGARHSVDAVAAGGWIAAGARIVGGCCRVTPAQIDNIAASLRAVA